MSLHTSPDRDDHYYLSCDADKCNMVFVGLYVEAPEELRKQARFAKWGTMSTGVAGEVQDFCYDHHTEEVSSKNV